MRPTFLTLIIAAVWLAAPTSAAASQYSLNTTYNSKNFLTEFTWFESSNSLEGTPFNDYLSQRDALAANITEVRDGSLFLRIGKLTKVGASRQNNRISSKQQWADGVFVVSVRSIPTGCFMLPVLKFSNSASSNAGSIKLLDGMGSIDEVTVTATKNCSIPSQIPSQLTSSTVSLTNCAQGCRIAMGSDTPTWGEDFNKNGGGTFAMVRDMASPDGTGVSIWFWKTGSEPADLAPGSQSVQPTSWGTPAAHFDIASACASALGPQRIVVDTPLGTIYASQQEELRRRDSCTQNFQATIQGIESSDYSDSYWQLDSIRVFTSPTSSATGGGSGSNNSSSPASAAGKSSAWRSTQSVSTGTGLIVLIGAAVAAAAI